MLREMSEIYGAESAVPHRYCKSQHTPRRNRTALSDPAGWSTHYLHFSPVLAVQKTYTRDEHLRYRPGRHRDIFQNILEVIGLIATAGLELIPIIEAIINGGLFLQAGPGAAHYTYDIVPTTNFIALAGASQASRGLTTSQAAVFRQRYARPQPAGGAGTGPVTCGTRPAKMPGEGGGTTHCTIT